MELLKRIKKAFKFNKKFQKMNRREQAVAIAEDVLLRMKEGHLKAKNMHYFKPFGLPKYQDFAGQELGNIIPETKKCEACAIGSLLYSCTLIDDNFKVPKGVHISQIMGTQIRPRLRKHFSANQLTLIEWAFEAYCIDIDYSATMKSQDKTAAIGYRNRHNLLTAKTRLKHIMQNIIDHKGKFNPHA